MKKLIFLILIQFFTLQNLFSQHYLYVSISNEELKPSSTKSGKPNDESLNKVFNDFGVKSYYQSFPNAKDPRLQNFYEIHFHESKNMNSFKNSPVELRLQPQFDYSSRLHLQKPI